jgi:hypothetical protein
MERGPCIPGTVRSPPAARTFQANLIDDQTEMAQQ